MGRRPQPNGLRSETDEPIVLIDGFVM